MKTICMVLVVWGLAQNGAKEGFYHCTLNGRLASMQIHGYLSRWARELWRLYGAVFQWTIWLCSVDCRHAPLYDGTDATLPKNLKKNTIMDKIEKTNHDHMTPKEMKAIDLFEGDIELTPELESRVDTSQTGKSKNADVDVNSITSKRNAIRSRSKIWPSRTIPIQLTHEAADAKENTLAAMREIVKHSCLKFRDRIQSDKRWIKIVRKNGCWSSIGRQNKEGGQELSIGQGCNHKGVILHELMHALGFWHEQSRTDRDEYVKILWENVKYGQQNNFNIYDAGQMDTIGEMYDFDSVMHYGNFAFSKNKKPTMLSIKNPTMNFGRLRSTLSKTDIVQLNALYDCKTKSGGWSSWTGWGPCNLGCVKTRERFCTDKSQRNCPKVDQNGIQTQAVHCRKDECNVQTPGLWGRWAPWGKCSSPRGQGYKTRSRKCDNPKPRNGGKYCSGTLLEVTDCRHS